MLVAFIIFFVVFVILGVLTFMGKTASFLTDNKTDEEGNPVYDNGAISKFLGIVMCLLALSSLMGIMGILIESAAFLVILAPIMFVGVLAFALIYSYTDNRFKTKGHGRKFKD